MNCNLDPCDSKLFPRYETNNPVRQLENPYNSRVLINNWYEDRRQYHQACTRCTGHTIYRTDFAPYQDGDYKKTTCIPPLEFEAKSKARGQGFGSMLNCDYLSNYTTTYDLMHNWEVRRAGCKPKPWRKWKLVADATWVPQPDNAQAHGNLTQFGFRKAPQLPNVPNDWLTYDMSTTSRANFPVQKYPDAYTLRRSAPPKHVSQEMSNIVLSKIPGKEDCCRVCFQKGCQESTAKCGCRCHSKELPPRYHPTLISNQMLKPTTPYQTLFTVGNTSGSYDQFKRPTHPPPTPGEPNLGPYGFSCDNFDTCAPALEAMKFQQGPPIHD